MHDFYQQAAGEDWSSEFERTLAAVGQTRPGSVYVRNAFFPVFTAAYSACREMFMKIDDRVGSVAVP